MTHPQNVEVLFDAGAHVDVQDEYGETPLEFRLSRTGPAEIRQVTRSVELVLDAGAVLTETVRELVREVGERFEEIREVYNPEELPKTEAALARLYELTGTETVMPVMKHDGVSPVRIADVTASTAWPAQFNALWDYLVPAMGQAVTPQGEVIRLAGPIAQEIDANGGVNWGARHRAMLTEARSLTRSLNGGRAGDDELYRIRELAVMWVAAQE